MVAAAAAVRHVPVALIAGVMPAQRRAAVEGEVGPRERRDASLERRRVGRILEQVGGRLARRRERIRRPLAERAAHLLIERDAADDVVVFVGRVEVGPAVRRLPGRAARAQFGPHDAAQRGACADRRPDIRRDRGVVEAAVRDAVVGGEAGGADRVVEASGCTGRRDRGVRRAVAATVELCGDRRCGGRAPRTAYGEELDDARHRVRAEQRRVGAADDLEPLDVLCGQRVEVEGAARFVHRDAVDQHRVVVALATADEEPGDAAGTARLDDRRAGRAAQQVADARRLASRDVVGGEGGGSDADLASGHAGPCRGDDDRFLNRSDGQRDTQVTGGAGDRGGLEAGERRFDTASGYRGEAEAAGVVREPIRACNGRGGGGVQAG